MNDTQRMHFNKTLKAKRQELLRDMQGQAARLTIGEGESDPIDQLQEMNQRDETVAALQRLRRTLSDVDDALRAISKGLYGACVECGESINLKRLGFIPWASRCVACQELLEQRPKVPPPDLALAVDGKRGLRSSDAVHSMWET